MTTLRYWWFRLRSACRWYWRARTRFDVHSPGLSRFIEQYWRAGTDQLIEAQILHFRRWYRQQQQYIPTPSLGAASKVRARDQRRLSELVRHSAIAPAEGQLLVQLARYTSATTMVELGTNGGISGAYLALAQPQAQLHTIEGNPRLAQLAQAGFARLGLQDRVKVYSGTFEAQLPQVLAGLATIDLLFIDGDHRYQPTLDHLRACLPLARPNSVFVIADIHWSPEMERAWAEVRRWPEIATSIDTYHFGLLFFKPEMQGLPTLELIKARYKPWRLGFF